MIRVDAGNPCTACDGLPRRSFLQIGMAGMASLGLPRILQAKNEGEKNGRRPKDTRVILIWLDGGPSHMDTYDLKPDAPAEYRGFWRPISTNVPGMAVTEMFPKHAKVADKFSLVRSLHHDDGDHFGGAHRMLTGRPGATGADTMGKYPSIGSITAAAVGARKKGLPAYVAVPYAMSIGIRPGYFAANYVGQHHDPFETDGDPNQKDFKVRNLVLPTNLSVDRISDRRTLQKSFDTLRREVDTTGSFDAMGHFEQQAYELVTSAEVRKAFDIGGEDEKLRDRYGRNSWGQSTLLARRLAEAGVTFTTVHYGGWDHHWNLKEGMQQYLPKVDAAVATLFEDLASRGLHEKTLVIVCGEFSRTPRMNDGSGNGTPGRDHWGNSMSVLMGGGGLKSGVVVGSTDAKGERPVDRPLTVQDFHATIYHVLGISSEIQFLDRSGRPVPAIDRGEPIKELV
jgi:acetyl esterase/lipase